MTRAYATGGSALCGTQRTSSHIQKTLVGGTRRPNRAHSVGDPRFIPTDLSFAEPKGTPKNQKRIQTAKPENHTSITCDIFLTMPNSTEESVSTYSSSSTSSYSDDEEYDEEDIYLGLVPSAGNGQRQNRLNVSPSFGSCDNCGDLVRSHFIVPCSYHGVRLCEDCAKDKATQKQQQQPCPVCRQSKVTDQVIRIVLSP